MAWLKNYNPIKKLFRNFSKVDWIFQDNLSRLLFTKLHIFNYFSGLLNLDYFSTALKMMMTDFEGIKEQSIKEKSILENVAVKLEDALDNARYAAQDPKGNELKIPSMQSA